MRLCTLALVLGLACTFTGTGEARQKVKIHKVSKKAGRHNGKKIKAHKAPKRPKVKHAKPARHA